MAKRNNKEKKIASILLYFNTEYSAHLGRLPAFQQLCEDLDVEVGTSLTQCKKVLYFPLLCTKPRTNKFATEREEGQRQHPRLCTCPSQWR